MFQAIHIRKIATTLSHEGEADEKLCAYLPIRANASKCIRPYQGQEVQNLPNVIFNPESARMMK